MGNLQEVLKELAADLAFTDSGVNAEIVKMVKESAKDAAKKLKSEDVALIDTDIEDVEVACYICTVVALVNGSLPGFLAEKHSKQH